MRPDVGYVVARAHALMRRMIRVGEVIEVAVADGLLRVRFEDTEESNNESPWLPWASSYGLAPGDSDATWAPPAVGSRVIVFSPYGDVEAGFVWGSLMRDANDAPPAGKENERVFQVGGVRLIIDLDTNDVTLSTDGEITVTGSGVTVDGGTGDAIVRGTTVKLNPP